MGASAKNICRKGLWRLLHKVFAVEVMETSARNTCREGYGGLFIVAAVKVTNAFASGICHKGYGGASA